MGLLLAQTGCGEGHSITGSGSNARQAISAHKTHHGCVHCQLSTPGLKSPGFGTARSRSWIIRLVATRPPPSLHMRATALSTAKPRRAKTPERAHATQWWPKGSMVRPHRQMRVDRGMAKRSLRHRRVLKLDESIRQWIGGSGRQESTCSGTTLRTQHRLLRVCGCQPCCELPCSWSSGSRGGGRTPAAKLLQDGMSNPRTSARDLAAADAEVKLCLEPPPGARGGGRRLLGGAFAPCAANLPNLPNKRKDRFGHF